MTEPADPLEQVMQHGFRRPLARSSATLLAAVLVVSILIPTPALLAQETEGGEADTQTEKQKAKEARIEEYLRKKEERIARRELRRQEKERVRAEKQLEQAVLGETEAAAAPSPTGAVVEPAGKQRRKSGLPRAIARVQGMVRSSSVGQDPTVREYLDLIDQQEADAYQLAAFANFLAQSGMNREALEYYRVALGMAKDDPLLWLNVGTLHRQLGELGSALSAYGRALSIDPNNAMAHFNIGAVLDRQGKYEPAIEAYSTALTLDPSLGDPSVNPQATNNDRLLAVKLRLYQQQAGSLGLPLVDVTPTPAEASDEDLLRATEEAEPPERP